MEVQQQNALFQYFSDTLAAVIQEAKKNGRYDMGILGKFCGACPFFFVSLDVLTLFDLVSNCSTTLFHLLDLGSGDEKVKKVDCRKFLTPGYTTSGHVDLYTVSFF